MADASYSKSVFHIERYQEKVAAKSHEILNRYDTLLEQENEEDKCKKLQEEAGAQKSSKLNQLFSTHPDLDARIQRMEECATSEGIEKPAVTE